jgi:hypothetical protein
MARLRIWLQVLIGWLPIAVLFAALLRLAHPEVGFGTAVGASLRMVLAAALLAIAVRHLAGKLPWPRPMRAGFVFAHLFAAIVYSLAWFALNSAIVSLLHGQLALVIGPGLGPFLIAGCWLYIMVAGVCYADDASRRAAELDAQAARARLDALRAQLNPHFLFNSLHAVVQLIPLDPARASQAAERLSALLRASSDDNRDLLPLRDEWGRVRQYLDLEILRFGERLVIENRIAPDTLNATVPSFALQTLVENAVRHGAEPRVEPTTISIEARREGARLVVEVGDDGAGAEQLGAQEREGGLARLRARIAALYGTAATLDFKPGSARGCRVRLSLPFGAGAEHADD